MVEDDVMIGEGLEKSLKRSGYSVDWIQDGDDVEPALDVSDYDLIILDLGLPNKDGIEILHDIRAKSSNISVLILTARGGIEDRVQGLDLGADDYMIKPFALEELEARVRLLSRRRLDQKTNTLKVANLIIDLSTHEVTYKGNQCNLSAKEFGVLRILMERPKQIFSRQKLEEAIYGWNEEVESNAIEVHVHQLRKKLGKEVIKNTRNVGYRIGLEE